jgi:hypothetical protein
MPADPSGAASHPAVADDDPAQVRPGQIWEWRGQMRPRDQYRVEFVGPDTVALAIQRRPPDRRPAEVKRVTRACMAAEYNLVQDAPPAPRRGRPSLHKEATDGRD